MRLNRPLLALVAACALNAGLAQTAAKLYLFDPTLQHLVGYGEAGSGEFHLTVNNYQGPVVGVWVGAEGKQPVSGSVSGGEVRVTLPGGSPVAVPDFLALRGVRLLVVVTATGGQAPVSASSPSAPSSPPKPAGSPAVTVPVTAPATGGQGTTDGGKPGKGGAGAGAGNAGAGGGNGNGGSAGNSGNSVGNSGNGGNGNATGNSGNANGGNGNGGNGRGNGNGKDTGGNGNGKDTGGGNRNGKDKK